MAQIDTDKKSTVEVGAMYGMLEFLTYHLE